MILKEIKCKRCGKGISTIAHPIYSSNNTMEKWQGICSGCVTEKERFQMLLEMNGDIKRRVYNG